MLSALKAVPVAVVLTAGLLTVATPADASVKVYSSCDNLHRDWKYGVAKSKKAAAYQYKTGHYRPAYGPKAQKVYWANYKGRDADRDGTACEVSR